LPLNEYVENIDNAFSKRLYLALDCDVSDFSGKYGLAVIAENDTDASIF
jgi:hypothetical protein